MQLSGCGSTPGERITDSCLVYIEINGVNRKKTQDNAQFSGIKTVQNDELPCICKLPIDEHERER